MPCCGVPAGTSDRSGPVGRERTTDRRRTCRLLPWQVRERQFRWTRLGRRGLDPDEVQTFLERVAGDLAAVHDALRESRLETARIKEALRRWQSEQAQRGQAARR